MANFFDRCYIVLHFSIVRHLHPTTGQSSEGEMGHLNLYSRWSKVFDRRCPWQVHHSVHQVNNSMPWTPFSCLSRTVRQIHEFTEMLRTHFYVLTRDYIRNFHWVMLPSILHTQANVILEKRIHHNIGIFNYWIILNKSKNCNYRLLYFS